MKIDIADIKIIDWQKALEQVDNDKQFLYEIVNDLFVEAEECYLKMKIGLLKNNFTQIYDTAHRIKGTANYLSCEQLSKCAQQLEILTKGLSENPLSHEQKKDIYLECKNWINEYEDAIDRVRDEYNFYFFPRK